MPTTPTLHWAFRLADEAATGRLGYCLGQGLRQGEHLALTGNLGAGKTTLCRHVAQGFGVADLNQVASPTYAYAHTYPAPQGPLHHLDLYRLDDAEAAYALGLDEILADPSGACLIEWADRVPELIGPQALWLQLVRRPQEAGRDAVLTLPAAQGPRWQALWPPELATRAVLGPAQ